MLIAFIALSLISVVIVGILGIVSNVNSLRQISIKNLKYDLSETQRKLDLFFITMEENVYFFTSSFSFDRFIDAVNSENSTKIDQAISDLMPEIMSFTHSRDYFYQIKFIDRNGNEQFVVENRDGNYEWLKRTELNKTGTRFYLYMANNILPNTASFLPVELKENNSDKLIPAVCCIYHVRKPNFFGILVFQIYAESFFKIINSESIRNPTAEVMLVNKEGFYLFHSENKTNWNQLSASKQTLNLRKQLGNELADKVLSDPSNLIYESGNYIIAQTKVFTSDVGLDNQYTLLISVPKKDIFQTVNTYKLVFGILFLFFLILSYTMALIATNQFIGPIRKLINKARIISTGNYAARVNIHTYDEIEELANQFNIMASSLQQREIEINEHKVFLEQKVNDRTRDLENEKNKLKTIIAERKKLQNTVIHSERLAATGELAAIIAHEMRNSLTSVRMILQLLSRKDVNSKSDIESYYVALDSVSKMERVVNDLLQFASPSSLERKLEDLNKIIESGVDLYKSHMQQKNIVVDIDLENNLPKIMIDKNRIKEVFINIILNAIQAIDGSGKITVSSKLISLTTVLRDTTKIKIVDSEHQKVNIQEIILKKGTKVIQLEIHDDGRGIHPKNIGRIFDPFFTTKINGTGLGLSLVKNVINQHGGIIKVHSQVQLGTKFVISLPLISE